MLSDLAMSRWLQVGLASTTHITRKCAYRYVKSLVLFGTCRFGSILESYRTARGFNTRPAQC